MGGGVTRMHDACVCMHASMTRGVWGMFPQEIRCSEIASEEILGQKQSRSSYMACGVLHPIYGCPCMHLLSQLTSNFHERRY